MPTWKSLELRLAKIFDSHRELEQSRKGGPDFLARKNGEVWGVEVKHRRKLPDWMHKALAKGRVAILHEHRQRLEDSFVMMRLKDFKELWDG